MKTKNAFKKLSLIYGIVVTLLFLLVFGPKFIGEFIKSGVAYLIEIPKTFAHWDESPTAFFITYLVGYAVLWWKPLWGSIIIMFFSVFYVLIAGVHGPPILAIPTFLVGLFYLLYWNVLRKKIVNN